MLQIPPRTCRLAAIAAAAILILLPPGHAIAAAQGTAPTAPPDLERPPSDAVKSASGLISKVLVPGTGSTHPQPTDVVSVHYTGWSAEDGEVIDSTSLRGKPAMFPLDKTGMAGFRECVSLMVPGEKRRCWLPEKLAYAGAEDRPDGTIVFDIELIDTWRNPLEPPEDLTRPPADAVRRESGLFYKVLRPGHGTRHPGPTDEVVVHYTGWTLGGRMFDSSIVRGEPMTLAVGTGVIQGWTEGLQLMVEGERARFWIPEDLAYKGQQGAPAGVLVFDIELIRIQ